MLTGRDSLDFLAEASPHLRKVLEDARAEWHPDLPPLTTVFGDLGLEFAKAYHEIPGVERRAIAERVELILREGDEGAKDAVATGFVEAVLHWTDRHPDCRDDVVGGLGNEAREYCRAWNLFTLGRP